MILADFSSLPITWLWGEFITIFLATIGGVLVFWGLRLENKGDKEKFSDINDFRSSKAKSKLGWRILMCGIALETLIAGGIAAKDGWEIWKINNAIKPKPLHERIQILLNEINPRILINLKTNSPGLWVDESLSQSQLNDLWRLYSEKGAQSFLGIPRSLSLRFDCERFPPSDALAAAARLFRIRIAA